MQGLMQTLLQINFFFIAQQGVYRIGMLQILFGMMQQLMFAIKRFEFIRLRLQLFQFFQLKLQQLYTVLILLLCT